MTCACTTAQAGQIKRRARSHEGTPSGNCYATHIPLAKKIPGLRAYEVTRGDVTGMAGRHAVYLVATLSFDSMAAIGSALSSPEGQATAADLANFATAGVDILMGDTKQI